MNYTRRKKHYKHRYIRIKTSILNIPENNLKQIVKNMIDFIVRGNQNSLQQYLEIDILFSFLYYL